MANDPFNAHVLVTGGAGFIGSHLVDALLEHPDARVTVLDKLTYAGSKANLAQHDGDDRLRFVQGDVADPSVVAPLVADVSRGDPRRGRDARRPFHQRSRRVRVDQRRRHAGGARCVPGARPAAPAGLDRRGLRPERARGHVRRGIADPSAQPVRGQQGGGRTPGALLRHHLRPAGVDRARHQRVRAPAEPGEGDPGLHHRRPRRPAAPRLRRRPPVARMALRHRLGRRLHHRAAVTANPAMSSTSATASNWRTRTSPVRSAAWWARTSRW